MIPGPGESEIDFQRRQAHMSRAHSLFNQKYPNRQIELIENLPVYYSLQGLKPWEAGALWIYETDDKILLPLIQLKKRDASTFAHEKIHALRIAFNEKRFEELLAYQACSKSWRRIWGALLSTPKTIWAFLLLSALPLLQPKLCIMPIMYLIYRAYVLIKDRRKLMNVIQKMGSLDYVLYLTDREILDFSKMTKRQIQTYLKDMQNTSFRIYKLQQLMS